VPRGRHRPNSAHKGYADHATGYRSAEYRNYLPFRPSVRPPTELRLDRYNHRSLTCGHESIRARSPCAPWKRRPSSRAEGLRETTVGNEEGTSREETTATNPKSHSGNRARNSTINLSCMILVRKLSLLRDVTLKFTCISYLLIFNFIHSFIILFYP